MRDEEPDEEEIKRRIEELGKRVSHPLSSPNPVYKKKSFDVIIHEDGKYEFIETTKD